MNEITREKKGTERERSIVCREGKSPEFRRGCNLHLSFVFPLFRSMRFLTFSKITREKKEEPGRDPTPV